MWHVSQEVRVIQREHRERGVKSSNVLSSLSHGSSATIIPPVHTLIFLIRYLIYQLLLERSWETKSPAAGVLLKHEDMLLIMHF